MKIENQVSRDAAQLVADCRNAVLAMCDADGHPHAAWMTAQVTTDLEEVVSITAPTSQKAAILRASPQGEWMFASSSLETIVYLSGRTRLIEGDAVKRYWDKMPGKAKAYYRKYCETEDFHKFAVILTEVSKVVLCKPYAYTKIVLFDKSAPAITSPS